MASIFEYNEERAMRFIREDEYSRGEKAGEERGRRLGEERGRQLGEERGSQRALRIIKLHSKGMDSQKIAGQLDLEQEYVDSVITEYEKE